MDGIGETDRALLLSGKRGRPPIGSTRMLRMYVVQNCFNLSDERVREGIVHVGGAAPLCFDNAMMPVCSGSARTLSTICFFIPGCTGIVFMGY